MLRKILQSFVHASRGLRAAWQDGWNCRIQSIAAMFLLGLIWYFQLSVVEAVLLLGAALFVIFAELMNTAIERTLDLVEAEYHPGVGRIKDIAAGGVFIASITALIAGLMVIFRHVSGL